MSDSKTMTNLEEGIAPSKENNKKEDPTSEEDDTSSEVLTPHKEHHKNYEEEDDHFDVHKYPMRQFEYSPPGFKGSLNFNPVVSGIGIAFLWGLAIWSMADPKGSAEVLLRWRSAVTYQFTWIFVGMRAAFFLFLVYAAIKFGHVKLGRQDEAPEFDTGSYFMMIFAAGTYN